MATWYAQAGSCNIADADWHAEAGGGGAQLTWGSLANGDVLEANGQTAIELDGNVGSGSVQATLRTLSGGGFTMNLNAGTNRTEYTHLLAGTTPCLVTAGTTYGFTFNGNILGGGQPGAYGLNSTNGKNGGVTINGNVTGGTDATAYGVYDNGLTHNTVITGNMTAQTAPAVWHTTGLGDTLTINGIITASATAFGVATQLYATLILGTAAALVGSSAWMFPIYSSKVKWTTAAAKAAKIRLFDATPTAVDLYVPDYPAEAEVQDGVDYDYAELQGTYDPVAAAVWPLEANVLEAEAAWGPTGADYAGTYHAPGTAEVIDTAFFGAGSLEQGTFHVPDAAEILISAAYGDGSLLNGTYTEAAAADVKDGQTFGPLLAYTGSYSPGGTFAEGEAAQLAADQATVLAAAASIKDDATILGQAGTYDFMAAIAAGFAAGQADQFAADAAFLETNKDEIIVDDTDIEAEFGVTGTASGGGGYTYGDEDPDFVLTTADGAGNYAPIADSDTVDGGVEYGAGEEGTGVNATTILSTLGLAAGNLDTQLAKISETVADEHERRLLSSISGAFASGVWTPMGTVIDYTPVISQEPCVLYEADPQILTGYTNVFKMWYTGEVSPAKLYYAESADGLVWTQHPSNPLMSDHSRPRVVKVGATYYLYTKATGGDIDLYSSPDGVTWTLVAADVFGSLGLAVARAGVWKEGSTWYALFDYGAAGVWRIGLATSTDGIAWTAYASNPVLPNATYDNDSVGVGSIHKIGSVYYLWSHDAQSGVLPTDQYLYRSADLHTWERTNRWPALLRRTTDEGNASPGGQIADGYAVEVAGKTYLFYDCNPNNYLQSRIKLAIADMPLADVVESVQGWREAPMPGFVFNDSFTDTRAAAAVNGTPITPGPGNRTVTDTSSYLSIANRRLSVSAGLSAWDDPQVCYPLVTRTRGRMLLCEIANAASGQFEFGLSETATGRNPYYSFNFNGTALGAWNAGVQLSLGTLTVGQRYRLAIVQRLYGAHYFIKGGNEYPNWTLVLSNMSGGANTYPRFGTYDGAFTLYSARVPNTLWMPRPLISDGCSLTFGTTDGLGHQEGADSLGTAGADETWMSGGSTWSTSSGEALNTAPADISEQVAAVDLDTADVVAQVRITATPGGEKSGLVLNLDSVSDPQNYVLAYHDGTNAKLDKVVAGVVTPVISAAATFAVRSDYFLQVIKRGTSYRLLYRGALIGSAGTISDAGVISNTLHGIFATAAAGKLDDVAVWPSCDEDAYKELDMLFLDVPAADAALSAVNDSVADALVQAQAAVSAAEAAEEQTAAYPVQVNFPTVVPLSASQGGRDGGTTYWDQYSAIRSVGGGAYTWTITDTAGNAISLAGKTVEIAVCDKNGNEIGRYTSEVTVTGDDDNVIELLGDDTYTQEARTLIFRLWNTTDSTKVWQETWVIRPCSQPTA